MKFSVIEVIDRSIAKILIESLLKYINEELISSTKSEYEKNEEFDEIMDFINKLNDSFKFNY